MVFGCWLGGHAPARVLRMYYTYNIVTTLLHNINILTSIPTGPTTAHHLICGYSSMLAFFTLYILRTFEFMVVCVHRSRMILPSASDSAPITYCLF